MKYIVVFIALLSTSVLAQEIVATTIVNDSQKPYKETIIIREFQDKTNNNDDDLYHRRPYDEYRKRDRVILRTIGTSAVVGGVAWGIDDYRHRRRYRY